MSLSILVHVRLIEYEGSGLLELRAGDYAFGRKVRDGKKGKLEFFLPKCVGLLMREARDRV